MPRDLRTTIDETERTKIVRLYRDHGLSLPRLRERFHRGLKRLSRVLQEEGIPTNRRSRVYQEAP